MSAKPISANRLAGRILLAMRPGSIEHSALTERFGYQIGNYLQMLMEQKLIERADGGYKLTPAGLEACPSRRAQ